jgi:1,4-alpha-glucan branching enzyme
VASVVGLAAAAGLVIGLSLTTGRKETVVEFALPVADAHRVALVGDFNHWDVRATPLTLGRGGGWRVAVPLSPGRHVYAFVVDGTRWVVDPAAPKATDDDFGTPNSLVTVPPATSERGAT